MKCSYCGSELENGAVFCTACGSRIEQENESKPEQPWYLGTEEADNTLSTTTAGGTAAETAAARGSGKKAVILAILFGTLTVAGILISELITIGHYHAVGMPSNLISSMLRARLVIWGVDFFELIIAAIPIVIVLIVRRKHLWKVKTKDIVLVVIFMAVTWLVVFFESLFVNQLISRLSAQILSEYSVTGSVLAIAGIPIITNGIAVALLILARTGSKKGTLILGIIAAAVLVLLTVFVIMDTRVFIRMITISAASDRGARLAVQTGAIVQCLSSLALLTMAACYGFCSPRSKRWLPVIIITTIGRLILTIAVSGVILAMVRNSATNVLWLISAAAAVTMIIGAVLMFAGAHRNRQSI